MFHPARKLAPQIHIQGEFVTYGIGGFSTYPKGWGLDIAYLNRSTFGFFGNAKEIIAQEIEKTVNTGIATSFFVPAFLRRLRHVAEYEWYFEKSRILFEYAHASFPQFKRYKDFQAFANECLGAVHARSPMALAEIVQEKIRAYFTGNMQKVIDAQSYLHQRHAEDVLKRVFIEMLGANEGLALFNKARSLSGEAQLTLNPEMFSRSFFVSEKFIEMLRAWHWEKIQYWSRPEIIAQEIKTVKWPARKKTRAYADTMRALTTMRPALCELLYALQLPIFIATDDNANFFRFFYGTIPMSVVKDEEEMQEYTVFGLCMYQPHFKGGVIVTHGGKTKERFWHTLAEEISHLADGPTDRGHGTGRHRYSGSRAFEEALEADRNAVAPWHRNNALGTKEWGQALTLSGINRFTRARLQKRIEAYDAALDFDHYARDERNAEIFAALPIVERALGKSLARKIMPNLFRYFDEIYLPGLKAEVAEYI